MTNLDFENIIKNPESYVLDFKLKYDFSGNDKTTKQKKFAIDVVSFSNTIRYEPAYIIIGISNNGELVGLNKDNQYRDDAKFQQIICNFKLFPHPNFVYYEINHNDKDFGIIKFPLPINNEIISIENIVYGRKGSANAILNDDEKINVSSWLKRIEMINFEKLKSATTNSTIIEFLNDKNIRKAKDELNKQEAENSFLRAQIFEIEGNYYEANVEYLKAVKLKPENPIFLKELSMNYFEIDDYKNALLIFNKLLKIFNYEINQIDKFLSENENTDIDKLSISKFNADIGALLFIQGKAEEGKIRLLAAYNVFKNYYGENHKKTENTKSVLDMINLIPASMFKNLNIEQAMNMLSMIPPSMLKNFNIEQAMNMLSMIPPSMLENFNIEQAMSMFDKKIQ